MGQKSPEGVLYIPLYTSCSIPPRIGSYTCFPHLTFVPSLQHYDRHTQGNVFTDFTSDYVATLLGEDVAQAVVIAVKLPVIYMLVITYVVV